MIGQPENLHNVLAVLTYFGILKGVVKFVSHLHQDSILEGCPLDWSFVMVGSRLTIRSTRLFYELQGLNGNFSTRAPTKLRLAQLPCEVNRCGSNYGTALAHYVNSRLCHLKNVTVALSHIGNHGQIACHYRSEKDPLFAAVHLS